MIENQIEKLKMFVGKISFLLHKQELDTEKMVKISNMSAFWNFKQDINVNIKVYNPMLKDIYIDKKRSKTYTFHEGIIYYTFIILYLIVYYIYFQYILI